MTIADIYSELEARARERHYIARMKRYAAFLRGVSPMNAKMPQLREAFEAAGFTEVRTVLSSGNVVFSAPAASEATLERKAEAAMEDRLGSAFPTIVRSVESLRATLASDPYQRWRLRPRAKRVVTFLRRRSNASWTLPIELDGARILRIENGEVFSAYVPSPRGPVFMALIEKTFGKEVTTRTWETVARVVDAAAEAPRPPRARVSRKRRSRRPRPQ